MISKILALVVVAQTPAAESPPPKPVPPNPQAYVEKGMPAPDRPWSAKDFSDAARLLITLKDDASLPLPRLRDDPSGGVFSKMIDPSGLKIAEDEKVPIPLRVGEALAILNATNRAVTIYFVANDDRQPFGPEVLELVLFELRVIDRLTALIDAFAATLTPEQRAEPDRQDGMKQMKGGFAQVVTAALNRLGESKQYGAEDLRAFAARLPDRIPPVWPLLPAPAQAEYRKKFEVFSKTHADPEFRKSMVRLIEKLDASDKR